MKYKRQFHAVSTRDAEFKDLSAASASASSKNVVIFLVAIPPMSVEAPDPGDRFHFRFPETNAMGLNRAMCNLNR